MRDCLARSLDDVIYPLETVSIISLLLNQSMVEFYPDQSIMVTI